MPTAEWYAQFAAVEAAGSSPVYERLSFAVSRDGELIRRLDELPPAKRQPNLLLAATRLAGAPLGDDTAFAEFVLDRWDDVAGIVMSRWTQTNEAARTAILLPLLATVDGPLALVELGCSAGLCLYPERYAISYDGRAPLTDSPVRIEVATSGPVPIAQRVPDVVARIGVDRNPLDVTDPDDLAWLEACIWPEHDDRRRRLRAAAAVVAAEPPTLLTGDMVDRLDDALGLVPDGATAVVIHSAAIAYLDHDRRDELLRRMAARPDVRWFASEAPGVVAARPADLHPPENGAKAFFVVSADGRAVAINDPHATWLRWADERGR